MSNSTQCIALDFGNTRVKCYAEGPKLIAAFSYAENNWCVQLVQLLKNLPNQASITIGVSSVNLEKEAEASLALDAHYLWVKTKQTILQAKYIDLQNVEGMGEDRIHGMVGALECSSPPLITIDCGTAITMNILGNNNRCLGGTIMPGFSTMLNSMHGSTSLLPQLQPEKVADPIGQNTKDAMVSGVSNAITGGILQVLNEYPEYSVIMLGGDADIVHSLIAPFSKKVPIIAKDCIARGIFRALNP